MFSSANVKDTNLLETDRQKPSERAVRKVPRQEAAHSAGTANLALKPPLKWAGGKRWLVPRLAGLWQPHSSRRYVEPFCGGLAAPLGLIPKRARLNDVNPHLINFYKHLQHGLAITIEMKNEAEGFYRQRDRFNELIENGKSPSSEAAQLFYYLNRTCQTGR